MRGLCASLVVVLLTAAFAGCLGGDDLDESAESQVTVDLPDELFDGFQILPLDFTAADGTSVAAHVYLPEGAKEDSELGTIVNLSPYYGNLYGIQTDGRLDAVRDGRISLNQSSTGIFVAHGFAYVAASVPGTGKSGGCFEIGGSHEQEVMAEFIDWVAEQEWSNGKVGMHGASYDGTTQWMVAVQAPESLVTIVPWVSITDMYEYMYMDGAPYAWWGPLFVPYYLLEVGWGLNPYGLFMNTNPEPDLLLEDACPQAIDQFTETAAAYKVGTYNDFWEDRNYRARLGDIQASVFMIHGLQDWNVKPLHADAVWDAIPTQKFAWLQQMRHNVPWANSFNEDWARDDYNATLLAWYDHFLNDADNGFFDALPPVWVQDTTGHWRGEGEWPPAPAGEVPYHLGDGTLTLERPADGETMIATPPSWTGAPVPTNSLFGPDGEDLVVAKFRTETLEAPMRISGTPQVELNVSVDRPGYSHLVAQIYEEKSNGDLVFVDMGGRGLPQREARDQEDPVVPTERMTVPVRMNPTDAYLEEGSRLLLLVSADDPSWFHHNGNAPTVWIEHGSTLSLPLLPEGHSRGDPHDEVASTNPFYQLETKEY